MIYMDNAATTIHKPEPVKAAVLAAMDSFGNAGRGASEPALNASRVIYETREKLARFFHGEEASRIVFTANSAFEPVIANLILTFHEPVNILKADTKNVGGVAKGEMILQFMKDSTQVDAMKTHLKERGLEIGEVD